MIKEPPRYIINILHVAVWMFLFLLSVSLQFRDYGFQNAMLRSLVNLSMLCGIFYLHFYLINKFYEKRRYFIYALMVVTITVVTTLARIFFNEQLIRLPVDEIVLDRSLSVWLFGIFTMLTAMVLSFLYQMVKNRYRKERQHLKIINQQNEAEIQYLKAQINPHFLFNSLNNIYSLSVVKSDKTPEMVLKLSSLLRYAIYEGQKNKVPLEKEVEQIKEFISLFEMKSEEKPNVEFTTKGNFSKVMLEPMLLIPLVENCFKHGGFENNPNAHVNIFLEYENNTLEFSTRNLIDENKQKDKVGGVGLSNIKKRLEANYKNNHDFNIDKNNGVFEVNLKIKGI